MGLGSEGELSCCSGRRQQLQDGVSGCPLLADCIGCMECCIIQSLSPGNHTLFVGEVVNAVFNREKTPLCTMDYEGCYLGKA